MKLLKNLADVSKEEQLKFINSFDHVLTDMDGVIWVPNKLFPFSVECINSLKQRGKTVRYVTNNTFVHVVDLWKRLVREGFNAEIADVVNPLVSVISYLKSINFNKKLYVVGNEKFKEELRKENFKLASDPPQIVEESISVFLKHISDDADVGAVILSWDLSMTFIKLQKVLTYLKRKDCLFIAVANDRDVPIGPSGPLIGLGPFVGMLRDFSGREPTFIGKPSEYFAQLITKKFDIISPKRALFIGDQIDPDMKFGFIGGYQKLLVLTGIAKIEDITNWKHPEEYKPEYYIESLGPFVGILRDFSGREPTFIGKPSEYFAQLITKKFDIIAPKRALFIGDQIDPDMKFGFIGGYQKLLVLTGIAKIEDITNWKHPEEYKPEYYIESLDVLNNILKTIK